MEQIIKKRYVFIDTIRGLAILLMAFFHFFYDLNLFGFVDIDFEKEFFWDQLPHLIITMFFVSIGMSLCIVHKEKINWQKIKIRTFILGLAALAVSAGTYVVLPTQWVYFGTLHCIAVSSLMALPLLRRPNMALAIALILLVLQVLDKQIPWFKLPQNSVDYIPPFPWIYAIFLGIFLYHHKVYNIHLEIPKLQPLLNFISKNALVIYLIHQPILYGSIYLYWLSSQ